MTSKLPRVTLVTPAYNQAEYLAETVESVLAIDYPNLEYIVLNDGSSDHTEEVLRSYDGRIRWETHHNMGQAATLNRGWGMATGEYLGYLSSDDVLSRQSIRSLVEALEARLDCGVAYGDFDIIDSRGQFVKTLQTEDYSRERLECDLICQPGVGALFRRTLFEQAGGWSAELRQVPDYEFWLRLAARAPFVRVPVVMGGYRVHEGSASFKVMTPERATEIVRVMDRHWAGRDSAAARRGRANALIFAAKNHAQSMRLKDAYATIFQALRLHPRSALRPRTWRALAAGTVRRMLYSRK